MYTLVDGRLTEVRPEDLECLVDRQEPVMVELKWLKGWPDAARFVSLMDEKDLFNLVDMEQWALTPSEVLIVEQGPKGLVASKKRLGRRNTARPTLIRVK